MFQNFCLIILTIYICILSPIIRIIIEDSMERSSFQNRPKTIAPKTSMHRQAFRTSTNLSKSFLPSKQLKNGKNSFRITNLKTQTVGNYDNVSNSIANIKLIQKKNLKLEIFSQAASKQKKQLLYQNLNSRLYHVKTSLTYEIKNFGNNSALIERLLKERSHWVKLERGAHQQSEINFLWGRWVSNGGKQSFNGKKGNKNMCSKLEFGKELTDKGRLYENIVSYCGKNKIKYDDFLPITFLLSENKALQRNVKQFQEIFKFIEFNTNLNNTWIYKPTNLNQGRDIVLFNSFQKLISILSKNSVNSRRQQGQSTIARRKTDITSIKIDKLLKIEENSSKKIQIKRQSKISNIVSGVESVNDQPQFNEDDLLANVKKCVRNGRNFILQKYVENPLIIDNRKFDIRVWILVDHHKNYYMFKEGYLRFTSYKYQLTNQTLNNNFMHLTNHALQKYSPNYSEKNILPMKVLKNWIEDRLGVKNAYNGIIENMKRVVKISLQATIKPKFLAMSTAFKSFQVFGYDFLIDRDLKVRLIEANTNPAITEDCNLLKSLVPRMMNDTFRLTIDRYFNSQSLRNYPLQGYVDQQNLWEKLGNLSES